MIPAMIKPIPVIISVVIFSPSKTTTDTPVLQLPEGYRPLWKLDKLSPEYRNAIYYLKNRGISIHDILRYRIGYCRKGAYKGKIIIPSYDANGSYFTYWMNALAPERYYKFKIRSKYADGTVKYFDNGYYFKVVR